MCPHMTLCIILCVSFHRVYVQELLPRLIRGYIFVCIQYFLQPMLQKCTSFLQTRVLPHGGLQL